MIYQIQYVTNRGKEVVDQTTDEQYSITLCREYSLAFNSPCIVVREDEPDFIGGPI
jgi:hypothetical protein